MPTPKPVQRYHEFFFVACRTAIQAGSLRLNYKSSDEAARARRRFYAFREAIYQEPSFDGELYLTIPMLTFQVDGHYLILQRKEI